MKERVNEAKWVESRQRYQINVQKDGKRKTFTSPICEDGDVKAKLAAEKKADKWLETGQKKDQRLGIVWKAFLEYDKEHGSKEAYIQHEKYGRLYILPKHQHRRLSTLTDLDWQECIDSAYKCGTNGKPLSKKSLSNLRGTITAFYAYCKKGRLPMEKPEDIDIPEDAAVGQRTILQPKQLKTFFAVDTIIKYHKPAHVFFIHAWRFEVLTGFRPGEVAGLQRKKDMKDQVLSIARAVNRFGDVTGGKNKRAKRNLKIYQQIQEVIEAQNAMLAKYGIHSMWLFPDEDGGPMDTKRSYKQWYTYRKQHGITSSLYELRHTLVSMVQNEMPEALLKKVVGHGKDMDTLGTYGHDVDGDLDNAAKIMENVFTKLLE